LIVPAICALAIFAAFVFVVAGLSRRMARYTRLAATPRLPLRSPAPPPARFLATDHSLHVGAWLAAVTAMAKVTAAVAPERRADQPETFIAKGKDLDPDRCGKSTACAPQGDVEDRAGLEIDDVSLSHEQSPSPHRPAVGRA
jgi:hypothetical protein